MQDFRHLVVWQRGMQLVANCYLATRCLPREERFGLSTQMRRSAVSIPSNIAEGCGRRTDADFGRFLYIAYGSACELETQAIAAKLVTSVDEEPMNVVITGCEEVRRMLAALIAALKS